MGPLYGPYGPIVMPLALVPRETQKAKVNKCHTTLTMCPQQGRSQVFGLGGGQKFRERSERKKNLCPPHGGDTKIVVPLYRGHKKYCVLNKQLLLTNRQIDIVSFILRSYYF